MGSSAVHIREAVMVTPSEPTPSTVIPLSALDSHPFLRFTIEYLFVYELPPQHHRANPDQVSTAALLKSALARALVPYYPLAGRVRPQSQRTGLEVVCRAQGAVFIEAISDYTAANFERPPRHVTQWRRLLSLDVPDVLQGAPALVIQLTWLRDGNAALGVGINHCLCDGIGSAEFLNSFAELARIGLTGGSDQFRPQPIRDRHLIDSIGSQDKSQDTAAPPEFARVTDVSRLTARFASERLVPTAVIFDGAFLYELKKAASLLSQPGSTYTSFEVLSAHVWRSWARSLSLPPTQILKLIFSVNIRKRVKPGIPAGYYGNAFVLGCARSSVRDLTEKGLGYVSGLIKQAKDRVDSAYVRSIIDSVREGRAGPDLTGTLILSQWSMLGLERVDFGMGRPVHVSPVCCDRYCLVLPTSVDRRDGVKVMVAVPASTVDKYERLVKSSYS